MNTSLRIEFREVAEPITRPDTKFGGYPVWIDGPQWPLSRRVGCPMQFIAQVALDRRVFPDVLARMAYIFMTDDGRAEETWDPNEGENAVILQPGSSGAIAHAPLYTGPTVMTPCTDAVTGDLVWRPLEYTADLTEQSEPPYIPPQHRSEWSRDELTRYWHALRGNKIGGSPLFLQDDEFPFEDWRLLLQLDGGRGTPFFVNFGDRGSAWAIANAGVTEAKLLWQG
jgi:hypothetical protein